MSTLGEVKARIADELNRTDLDSQIGAAITRAIRTHGAKRFWFLEARQTQTVTAEDEYVNLPSGTRNIDLIQVQIGETWYPLCKVSLAAMDDLKGMNVSEGQPTDYAVEKTRLRLYPTPDQAYTLSLIGTFDLTLADDSDTNAWTTEAEDLIVATVKKHICRDIIIDETRAMLCQGAETEALNLLQDETVRRLSTGIRPCL
ncbi:phage adaptor protein [Methylocaldum sp.]|uniref:phage adaptor protein n=1 Tax=Methylocaldum sp. TaxID=1969727 RepID=UPI002D55BF50|nr:hypothetical protein [Methylocaldum sp.]HYE38222.1 hypothetical protein [Methylocaldum sp.]